MTIGDVVEKTAGGFGLWQLRVVLIMSVCKISAAWFMACILFTAPAPRDGEITCLKPPQYSHLNTTEWIEFAHPTVKATGINRTRLEYCYVFDRVYDQDSTRHPGLIKCNGFNYYADFYSLVQQFDLVCDREMLILISQSFHLFGVLVGGVLTHFLMKYKSPRNIMLLGMIFQIVLGILTGYAEIFLLHCFLRWLTAICCALMFTGATVILTGITAGKYCVGVNILYDEFWSIGLILLPILAHFFNSWNHLYLAMSLATLTLILLYPWIPDAPQWHLNRGDIEKAQRILLEAAETNKRRGLVPANIEELLIAKVKEQSKDSEPAGWWTIWKGPKMTVIMIAAHIAWAVCIIDSMGMLLNIRSFSGQYMTMSTIITGLSEMVGCFMALLFTMYTKQKWIWAGMWNVLAGAIGFLTWMLPDEMDEILLFTLWILISSIAKAGISVLQSMLMGCTGELVPPKQRQIFCFSCVTFGRLGLMSAPFINLLAKIDAALSMSFFTLLQVIGGLCVLVLHFQVKGPAKNAEIFVSDKPHCPIVPVWTTSSDRNENTKL